MGCHRARGLALAVLVGAVAVSPSTGHAGVQEAKRLFAAAEAQFAAGDYQQARQLYERAYREKPLPALLINIGQCHLKLGDCQQAIRYYQRYLVSEPTGRHRPLAEQLIRRCEQEIEADGLLEEQKREQPRAGAGAPRGATSATGSAPGEGGAAGAGVEGVGAGADAATAVSPATGGGETGTRRKLHPIYFWSSAGLALAMVMTGTVTGALALSKSSEYKDPATPASKLDSLRDQGKDLKVAANVTFGIGLGAAVGAAVLFFFTDFGGGGGESSAAGSGAKRSTLTAGFLPGGGLLGVGGEF